MTGNPKEQSSDERQAAIQQEIARRFSYGDDYDGDSCSEKYSDLIEWCDACLLRAASPPAVPEALAEIHAWRHVAAYYLGDLALTASPEECRAEAVRRAVPEGEALRHDCKAEGYWFPDECAAAHAELRASAGAPSPARGSMTFAVADGQVHDLRISTSAHPTASVTLTPAPPDREALAQLVAAMRKDSREAGEGIAEAERKGMLVAAAQMAERCSVLREWADALDAILKGER